MKRRVVGLVLLGLVAYVVGLVATFPAARAVALAQSQRVDATGVSGSVWHGSAMRVALGPGTPLTGVRWDVQAWRLLTGRLAANLHFSVGGADVQGHFAGGPDGRLAIDHATVRGPVAGLAELAPVPVLALDGQLLANIDEARIEGGWPRMVRGRFEWTDARVIAPVSLRLGTVNGRMMPGDDGAQRLELKAAGGQLAVSGEVRFLANGQYRVDLRLVPAADAPANIADTLSLFARRSGDGAFVVRRGGRLGNL